MNLKNNKYFVLFIKFFMLFVTTASFLYTAHSFSYLSTNLADYNLHSAIRNNKASLHENRYIVGYKGDLAEKYNVDIKKETIPVYWTVTYQVGLNNEASNFHYKGSKITPISTRSIRYSWSSEINPNSLIQSVQINELAGDIDSDNRAVVISRSLYESLVDKKNIDIYSSHLDKTEKFNIIGYYNNGVYGSKNIPNMFFNTYTEPMFFNSEAFFYLFNGKQSFQKNMQCDVMFDTSFPQSYSRYFKESLLNKESKKEVVLYDSFSSVSSDFYYLENDFKNQITIPFAVFGSFSLIFGFTMIALALLVDKIKAFAFSSIKKCNPIIYFIICFLAILIPFGIGKLAKWPLLFYEPCFSYVLVTLLVIYTIYLIIYCARKVRRNYDGTIEKVKFPL